MKQGSNNRSAVLGTARAHLLQAGFTLYEMLVVMLLTSIMSYIGIYNLKEMTSPIQDATTSTVSFLKIVRARALATTSAYTVYPVSEDRIAARFSNRCDDDPELATVDSSLQLSFPAGADLLSTEWSVCFTARGLVASDLTFGIRDVAGLTRQIEVLLGGSVRILS